MNIPWIELTQLGAQVVIVVYFLRYLAKRDSEIQKISERCHETQEAGHTAIKELTVAIMRTNGKKQ